MPAALSNAEIRDLKARAQKLEPVLHLGKNGLSESFLQSVDRALTDHGLIKIKFAAFKEEKKTMAPQIAEKTDSVLVMRVGNVAVYFRPKDQAP